MVKQLDIDWLDESVQEDARQYMKVFGVPLHSQAPQAFSLVFSRSKVSLRNNLHPKVGDVLVDFNSSANAHRRKHGGGYGQYVAKACGVSARFKPSVFDATAGLGQDAFVLASLGSEVTMMERSPVAYCLLADGLKRARLEGDSQCEDVLAIVRRMRLIEGDSIHYMGSSGQVDVVYLDPMFPPKQKSAQVKKEMAAFHSVVGYDQDEAQLLEAALGFAQYRVVVKRPRLAPSIPGPQPNSSYMGKSSRFDIYGLKRLPLS